MSITTVALHWIDAQQTKPDADMSVLMWTRDEYGRYGWEAGWWDGTDWRFCESGGVCIEPVTHWSQPEGPTTNEATTTP